MSSVSKYASLGLAWLSSAFSCFTKNFAWIVFHLHNLKFKWTHSRHGGWSVMSGHSTFSKWIREIHFSFMLIFIMTCDLWLSQGCLLVGWDEMTSKGIRIWNEKVERHCQANESYNNSTLHVIPYNFSLNNLVSGKSFLSRSPKLLLKIHSNRIHCRRSRFPQVNDYPSQIANNKIIHCQNNFFVFSFSLLLNWRKFEPKKVAFNIKKIRKNFSLPLILFHLNEKISQEIWFFRW